MQFICCVFLTGEIVLRREKESAESAAGLMLVLEQNSSITTPWPFLKERHLVKFCKYLRILLYFPLIWYCACLLTGWKNTRDSVFFPQRRTAFPPKKIILKNYSALKLQLSFPLTSSTHSSNHIMNNQRVFFIKFVSELSIIFSEVRKAFLKTQLTVQYSLLWH